MRGKKIQSTFSFLVNKKLFPFKMVSSALEMSVLCERLTLCCHIAVRDVSECVFLSVPLPVWRLIAALRLFWRSGLKQLFERWMGTGFLWPLPLFWWLCLCRHPAVILQLALCLLSPSANTGGTLVIGSSSCRVREGLHKYLQDETQSL